MERSKSFHTLSASYRDQLSNNTNANTNNNNQNNNQNNNNSNNINDNNNIINNNNNNNNMIITNTNSMSSLNNLNINQTAMNLRKQLELQQTRLQRQQLHLSGSSDSINALKVAATVKVKLPILLPTARTNAVIAAAAATAMRKKLLQRQRSTAQADGEFVDEVDYAADLEIDEDDEDDYDDDDDDDEDDADVDDDNIREDDGDIETVQHDDVSETRRTKTTQRIQTTAAIVEKGVYEEHVAIEKPTVVSTTTVATAHKKRFLFQQRQPRNRAMPQFSNSAHCLPTQLQLNTNLTGNNNNTNKQDSNNNNNSGHSTVPSTPTYKTGPGSKTRNSSTSSAISLDGRLVHGDSFDSATDMSSPTSRRHQFAALKRDNSMQSDSSRYSSVDSLLEARKPDPEAILINLGFGPGGEDVLSRIPKRFLKPSQVRGIDTDAFVKRLQLANTLADHSVLGYRGLTGNPDIPPSSIVAKIMQRFEVNERKKSMGSIEQTMR